MVSFRQPNGLRKPPALKRLHEVQEEIYRQLHLLVPDCVAYHDHLVSRVSGSPPLRMEILERHPYTTFLRLTYEFETAQRHSYAPDAHIRFYLDAHMAEATSFNTGQGCTRTAHPSFPAGSCCSKPGAATRRSIAGWTTCCARATASPRCGLRGAPSPSATTP